MSTSKRSLTPLSQPRSPLSRRYVLRRQLIDDLLTSLRGGAFQAA